MNLHVNRRYSNEAYSLPLTGTESFDMVKSMVEMAESLSFEDVEDGHASYFRENDDWFDVNRLTWFDDELAALILSNARALAALSR